jgi:hypothetical protein
MNSVLRRSSFSGKSDQSGSESDVPSRKSSGDKDAKRQNRKRVSFGIRPRGDTGDTLEHSQLAKQVVDATNADKSSLTDDKPIIAITALPLDSSAEYTKSESPIEAREPSKDVASQEPTEPSAVTGNPEQAVEHVEEPKEEVAQSTAPPESQALLAEVAFPVQVEEIVAPSVEAPASAEGLHGAATDVWAMSKDHDHKRVPSESGNK